MFQRAHPSKHYKYHKKLTTQTNLLTLSAASNHEMST